VPSVVVGRRKGEKKNSLRGHSFEPARTPPFFVAARAHPPFACPTPKPENMRPLRSLTAASAAIIGTSLLLLSLALLPPAAQAAAAAPTAAAAAAADERALRAALATHLRGPHFAYWLDPRNYVRERLVIQARRLYYLSTMASSNPDPLACEGPLPPEQRAAAALAADDAFLEMSRKFRQPEGGWRFWLDADANANRPQQVAMYGQVFALYALSTYAANSGGGGIARHAADARALAHRTFDEIAARLSPSDGAVQYESYSPDFETPLPGGQKANAVGSDGVRALGTHLHLIEALIAYRRLLLADTAAAAVAGGAGGGSGGQQKAATAALRALGWATERRAESRAVLERAASLLLSMRQGKIVLELRDAHDARLPASMLAADATGGQGYLPGHGVQAAFQLWDALEVLEHRGDEGEQKRQQQQLTKAAVLEFATAMLEGARELEQQGGGGSGGSGASSSYRWLPHIYRLDRVWQIKREAERIMSSAVEAVAGGGAADAPSSSSSLPRRRQKRGSSSSGSPKATTPLPPPPPKAAMHVGWQAFESEVNWWSQMEHMLALLRTAKELPRGGGERRAYVERAAAAWALLSQRFADPATGAFHWSVDRQGPTMSAWKASYHSSRAMVNGLRSLCAV
jgi:mannose/cellobiose epimerase-like protein (N-acyl-D-glucosamine 2-epimerase family)